MTRFEQLLNFAFHRYHFVPKNAYNLRFYTTLQPYSVQGETEEEKNALAIASLRVVTNVPDLQLPSTSRLTSAPSKVTHTHTLSTLIFLQTYILPTQEWNQPSNQIFRARWSGVVLDQTQTHPPHESGTDAGKHVTEKCLCCCCICRGSFHHDFPDWCIRVGIGGMGEA